MIRRILTIGVVAVLAGCATDHFDRDKMASSGTTSGSMAAAGTTGATGSMCPAQIPNTTVQVRDTSNGVAMDFVTSGNVDDLRSSVHNMAQHEQQVASAGGTYGANPQGSSGSSSGSTYGSNDTYGSASPDNGGQVRTSNPESGSASSGSQAKSGAEGGEGEECDTGTSGSAGGSASGSSAMNGSSGTYGNTGNCTSAGCGAFGVPVNAQVQDISGGSQLVLKPVDASQLDTLRQNAHQVGMMMQSGQCPPSSKPSTGG